MPATQLKLRRGTAAQHGSFTGSQGEITVVTDDWSVRIHDGTTAGGHAVGGVSSLSALTDVNLTTPPTNGQTLVYDSASNEWKPGAASGGGGGGASYTVNRFLSSGTWTKPENLQFILLVAFTGGNGGNSGSYLGFSSQYDYSPGGYGGYGGFYHEAWITADSLPSSLSVLIGQAGTGGTPPSNQNSYQNSGSSHGSVRFGDLLYLPTGPYQVSGNQYPSDLIYYDNRTDNFTAAATNSGSGSGPKAHDPPMAVRGPWDGYEGVSSSLKMPTAGASGACDATSRQSWYYGPQGSSGGMTFTHPFDPGVAFWPQKPPLLQVANSAQPLYSNQWVYNRRNTHTRSGRAFVDPFDANQTIDGQPYGYDQALAALSNPSEAQVAALQRKHWGDGGGGGGISGVNYYPQNGGNGAFPGGGGGGGCAGAYNYAYAPGSGGNGGACCIWVYNFIVSSNFAFSTANLS